MATSPLPSALPIIQAPMAGGPSTPELTAAVGRSGGFGFLAAGYRTPDQLRSSIEATRRLSDAPFGVNIFHPTAPADPASVRAYAEVIRPESERLGVPLGEPRWDDDAFADKLEIVASERVPIGELHLRLPRRGGGRLPARRRLHGRRDRHLGPRGPGGGGGRAPTWSPCRAPRPAATRAPSSTTSRTGCPWPPSSRRSGGSTDLRPTGRRRHHDGRPGGRCAARRGRRRAAGDGVPVLRRGRHVRRLPLGPDDRGVPRDDADPGLQRPLGAGPGQRIRAGLLGRRPGRVSRGPPPHPAAAGGGDRGRRPGRAQPVGRRGLAGRSRPGRRPSIVRRLATELAAALDDGS